MIIDFTVVASSICSTALKISTTIDRVYNLIGAMKRDKPVGQMLQVWTQRCRRSNLESRASVCPQTTPQRSRWYTPTSATAAWLIRSATTTFTPTADASSRAAAITDARTRASTSSTPSPSSPVRVDSSDADAPTLMRSRTDRATGTWPWWAEVWGNSVRVEEFITSRRETPHPTPWENKWCSKLMWSE